MPAGHILSTTAIAPTLWTDSFPPYAAVEPVLSDPQKPNDPVGFKEVFASDTEVGMHMQSLHMCLTPARNLQGILACWIASSSQALSDPGQWQSLAWQCCKVAELVLAGYKFSISAQATPCKAEHKGICAGQHCLYAVYSRYALL